MSYTFIAPIKDPFAEKRHGMDWTDDLDEGEQITGIPIVEVTPAGLEVDQVSVTDGIVSWRVRGGEAGKSYIVTFKITTNGPEKDARSVRYPVRDR